MTELGHLLVADRLFQQLGWPEGMRPMLYLGAIAPDAYRVTLGVDYRDVHFRETRRQGLRLTDFLQVHLRPALAGKDFVAKAFFSGWLSHICADYAWRQRIRSDLTELWEGVLSGPRLEALALKHQFYDECDWVDIELYRQEGERVDEIRALLAAAEPTLAIPPLQPGDIYRWRQQVCEEMLPPANYTVEAPSLLSMEFMRRVMAEAEEEAAGMLSWENRLAQESVAREGMLD